MIEQASLVLGNGNWAVKSDSLLGYKTIDGKYYPREMTFTRATTGTRVNEAGLIEIVPYNLFERSEEFNNAYWTKASSSVTANTATAPNGTMTADTVTLTTASGRIEKGVSLTGNIDYTLSVYAKNIDASNGRIGVLCFNNANTLCNCGFDLVGSGLIYAESNATAAIESVGDGWYRCSITFNSQSGATSPTIRVVSNAAGSSGWTVGQSIYIWGAQLVEGTQPLDYLPTTDRLDIARIDYSTGEAALLLEPQRTNLALQSSSFDSATWTKTALTVTANNAISPSGVQDADLITANGTTSQHSVLQTTGSGAKTYSVFAKMGTQRYIQILTSGSLNPVANYDLQDGVANMVGSNSTASIEDYGNGWYRCILQTNEVLAANFFINYVNSLVAPRYQSILSSDTLYLWGAQAEAGAYATSYIPTASTSVTRNAEVYNRTGISSLIGQTEGTMFVGIYDYQFTPDNASPYLEIYADANNRIIIYKNTSNQYQAVVRTAGVTTLSITTASISGNSKIAIGYKENDCVVYVNGVQVGTDTSVTIPACSNVYLGRSITGISVQKDVFNVAALWKERLTNDELATLTTL